MYWTDMAHHVARKTHACDLCLRRIEPGERYARQRGYDAGDAWTFRACPHCEAVWAIYDIEPFDTGLTYDDMDGWASSRDWRDWTEAQAVAHAVDLLNPFGDEDITVEVEATLVTPDVEMHYGRALDEVYHLRRLCADEALVRQADQEYKTYPRSRREIGEGRINRLRQAACGNWQQAIAGRPSSTLDAAMRMLDQKTTLTRHQFEQEQP